MLPLARKELRVSLNKFSKISYSKNVYLLGSVCATRTCFAIESFLYAVKYKKVIILAIAQDHISTFPTFQLKLHIGTDNKKILA